MWDIASSLCRCRAAAQGCGFGRRGLQRDVRLAALIPARYSAQRLPGKPLADLCGAPLIVRVCQRVARADGLDEIAVATDDARIAHAVTAAGFRAVMTGEARNGTERIAQAAQVVAADAYLNVQGDEPLLDPRAITAVANVVRQGAEMATAARPLQPGEADQPSVVKVVLDHRGRALYFSRSPIPFPRSAGEVAPLAHLGIYGFSATFLYRFAKLPETALERAEGLEQLRALYHGHGIEVAVGPWSSAAVDTPEDLERVRALYSDDQRRHG
jgi:3-deoxy-manno-octulosonate cytidylyltransferase (CMP-KDO synthetase)